MAQYVVDVIRGAGGKRVVAIVGHKAEEVKQTLGSSLEYALQKEQLGSGHATLQAEGALGDFTGTLMVLPADTPLLTPESLKKLVDYHEKSGAAATILTAILPNPAAYGRIIRKKDGSVSKIVEAKDCTPDELAVKEINTGVYCFQSKFLFEMLHKVRPENAQGEYYLTDVIGLLVSAGEAVKATAVDDPESAMGINNRMEMSRAAEILRRRILNNLMLSGVTVEDPASTFIEATVKIKRDTIIKPFSILKGNTEIGEDCVIGPSAQISNSKIADRVIVNSSVVDESEISEGTSIGPWSRLRPGCKIGKNVYIGNFSELKNSKVADFSQVHHVGYLGDATVGEKVNIGAGTITCNFNGKEKNPTYIEDGAFIGSNTLLVAPVTIGKKAATGAGTVVIRDVPESTLVVGVPAREVRKIESK